MYPKEMNVAGLSYYQLQNILRNYKKDQFSTLRLNSSRQRIIAEIQRIQQMTSNNSLKS